MLVYHYLGGIFYLTYYLFAITPTGFVPSEDKGVLMVSVNLKPGSSISQTIKVRKKVEDIIYDIQGVENIVSIEECHNHLQMARLFAENKMKHSLPVGITREIGMLIYFLLVRSRGVSQ